MNPKESSTRNQQILKKDQTQILTMLPTDKSLEHRTLGLLGARALRRVLPGASGQGTQEGATWSKCPGPEDKGRGGRTVGGDDQGMILFRLQQPEECSLTRNITRRGSGWGFLEAGDQGSHKEE